MARGIDRRTILIKVRSLTRSDIERCSPRCRVPIKVYAFVTWRDHGVRIAIDPPDESRFTKGIGTSKMTPDRRAHKRQRDR